MRTVVINGIDPGLAAKPPIRPVVSACGCDGDQVVCPLAAKVIRARVRGLSGATSGRNWSSAPQYEHRRDTAPVVSGVRDLLDDACTVLPALGSTGWPSVRRTADDTRQLAAGPAPGFADPSRGRSRRRRFLMAPWTAELGVSNSFRLGPPHDRRCQRATGRVDEQTIAALDSLGFGDRVSLWR